MYVLFTNSDSYYDILWFIESKLPTVLMVFSCGGMAKVPFQSMTKTISQYGCIVAAQWI